MAEEDQEKHLDPKLKAASVLKHKGMTALQRQAEHQATQLRKLIFQEKEMEQEQVAASEQQAQAAQARCPSKFLQAADA